MLDGCAGLNDVPNATAVTREESSCIAAVIYRSCAAALNDFHGKGATHERTMQDTLLMSTSSINNEMHAA